MPIKVYVETSVFGGVFDAEFQSASRLFFDEVKGGRFDIVISGVVSRELAPAPENVRQLYLEMLRYAEVLEISEDALKLRNAYLDAGIVSHKWIDDALHVAMATVSGCALLLSWNFKHIVHFQKIPLYNAINTLNGYGQVKIYSPSEVLHYENEDV